jgi:uncharacterized protein (DUF427 family)
MSIRVRELLLGGLDSLRYEPTEKRIRAELGGRTVVDSHRGMLVWEPKRVVPSYAVPVEDVDAEVSDAPEEDESSLEGSAPRLDGRPVYDPSVPFSIHTTKGRPVTIRHGEHEAAGFRPTDPELADYLILDFVGFDAWYEEAERNLGHPRDPFHRIDIVHSTRHVRVARDGHVLAETWRPYLLFEPPLPPRYYLPREDVRTDLLHPSDKVTVCAYKGHASYWSLEDEPDIAWSYEHPLREAAEVTGRLTFFNERVDIVVDGNVLERPVTPWSPR